MRKRTRAASRKTARSSVFTVSFMRLTGRRGGASMRVQHLALTETFGEAFVLTNQVLCAILGLHQRLAKLRPSEVFDCRQATS